MSLKKLATAFALGLIATLTASALTVPAGVSVQTGETITYTVDSAHSIAVFDVRHLGVANFYGTFDRVSGEVIYNSEKPSECQVKIEIDANSIDANSEDREAHLKDTGFFDSKHFPTWTFESKSVKEGKKGVLQIVGDLTLKGVTKEIETEFLAIGFGKTMMGDERAGWEARFTIDRTDYGISDVLGGLGKNVNVLVSIEAIKQSK